MAEIFVSTTGNDTTGTGLSSAPYLSIRKAFSMATSGDFIRVLPGTYAEDSGSGYFSLAFSFSSYVHVVPDNGIAGSVIITATTATQTMIIVSSAFIRFHNIIFRSQSAAVTQLIRFSAANINNLIFDNCEFQIIGNLGSTNLGIASSWLTTSTVLDYIRFIDCTWTQLGPYPVAGLLLDKVSTTMTVNNFQFINPVIKVGGFAMRIMGLTKFLIQNPQLSSTMTTVASTALQIGQDAAVGVDTTGIVSGGSVTALIGHAAVIGAGVSDVQIVGTTFYGGYNSSNGQGLVLKNATGGIISKCIVHGGYLSTLYLKACKNMLIEDSEFYNRFATSSAIRAGFNNEDSSKISRNVLRGNRFYTNVGPIFDWSNATGDDGGSVVDQNVYNIAGTGTWGAVRGTIINSLGELKSAWTGYDRPSNDRNSKSGLQAVPHSGDRKISLG